MQLSRNRKSKTWGGNEHFPPQQTVLLMIIDISLGAFYTGARKMLKELKPKIIYMWKISIWYSTENILKIQLPTRSQTEYWRYNTVSMSVCASMRWKLNSDFIMVEQWSIIHTIRNSDMLLLNDGLHDFLK